MKIYYICRCVTFDQTLDRVPDSCISYYTGWVTSGDGTYCVSGWSSSIDEAIGFASIRDASSLCCSVCDEMNFFDYFVDERVDS